MQTDERTLVKVQTKTNLKVTGEKKQSLSIKTDF